MIGDNFAMGVREAAAITNTTIDGPGIGVSIDGGLLTGLKITAVEVPKKLERNMFTNNFGDINTTYVGGIDDHLHKNIFDIDGPKINRLSESRVLEDLF